MHDCDLRSGTRCHVRKLEGNIPASDEQDSLRKFIKLEELVARSKMLFAGNLQARRSLPGRNHHIAALQNLLAHLNCGWADETSATMECRYAGLRKPLFPLLRNRLRERTLEAHQLLPINPQLLGLNSLAFHAATPINHLRSAHKHLFRVASTQGTSTPERPRIDNRNLPSGQATPRCYRRCGRPRSDRD